MKNVAATPERLSVGLSVTVALVFVQPVGAEAVVTGAVLSMLTAELLELVVLPALSLTEAVANSPLPSPLMVLFPGHNPMIPDRASVQVQAMLTLALYQPFALAAVVGVPVRVGGVLS